MTFDEFSNLYINTLDGGSPCHYQQQLQPLTQMPDEQVGAFAHRVNTLAGHTVPGCTATNFKSRN